MRKFSLALAILALTVWAAPASAEGLFQRCKDKKEDINNMKSQVDSLGTQMDQVRTEIKGLEARLKKARAKYSAKSRQERILNKKIKRSEAQHKRMCKPLERCGRLEKKVEDLKASLQPLHERLKRIRKELRKRSDVISKLNQDIRRIENKYGTLGCANLQIGESDQTTFDACAQLSRDWNDVKTRIDRLNKFMKGLRNRMQDLMQQRRAKGKELRRLTKQMRASCSHSHRLVELEALEKQQDDYRSLQDELDKMDTEVKRFHGLKLMKKLKKAPKKPMLKPRKDKKNDKDKKRKRRRGRRLKRAD